MDHGITASSISTRPLLRMRIVETSQQAPPTAGHEVEDDVPVLYLELS
jgi:hypothetical protein